MDKSVKQKERKESKCRIVRGLYLVGGFISLALGCIGIIIPILPTVPFFLCTSFFFVRGSKKFHDWFLSSKLYKKHLEGFVKHRAMNIVLELLLMGLVSTMLIVAMIIVNKLAMTIVICVLLAIKYVYFVFKVKPVTKTELILIRETKE